MAGADYWHRQSKDQPLFPDMLWSRPENKRHAGKLAIVGGNLHGFSAPAIAYTAAQKAGVGRVRVVLPDAIQKVVSTFLPEASFAPSTPSGSFGSQSLAELLENANWADGALIAGDIGKNSETTVLIESFASKYTGQLTITKDAIDLLGATPASLLQRQDTSLVMDFGQLQKIAKHANFTKAFTSNMGMVRLVEALYELTIQYPINIMVTYENHVVVAANKRVSSTEASVETTTLAACGCVWWLQHPSQPFEAITTAITEI